MKHSACISKSVFLMEFEQSYGFLLPHWAFNLCLWMLFKQSFLTVFLPNIIHEVYESVNGCKLLEQIWCYLYCTLIIMKPHLLLKTIVQYYKSRTHISPSIYRGISNEMSCRSLCWWTWFTLLYELLWVVLGLELLQIILENVCISVHKKC